MRSLLPFIQMLVVPLVCATSLAAARPERPVPACRLPAGTRIQATLRTSLDTRYTAALSSVVARLQHPVKRHGRVLLPEGTQLLGKVLQSRAESHGKPAQLQILFNQVLLPDGNTIAVAAGISAVFTRARRAVLDRASDLEPGPRRDRRAEAGGDRPDPFTPGGHQPFPSRSATDEPTAAADPDALPARQPAGPDLTRDSDGVPLRIQTGEDPRSGSVIGGSRLIGRGSAIRLHAGTRVEIRVANTVPLPGPCSH